MLRGEACKVFKKTIVDIRLRPGSALVSDFEYTPY